ncbi:hypothetical protein WMY93_006634 [Mugilogobius chulae]|uniref:Uncharacterized protein n=1 Tax=Mugilogobius chulae TaxID=88201 RepID=A0AAW0PNV2_9GOBI
MARNVNFDQDYPLLEAGLESPADEAGVHDSFHQLIEEQSQNAGVFEAHELQSCRGTWMRTETMWRTCPVPAMTSTEEGGAVRNPRGSRLTH